LIFDKNATYDELGKLRTACCGQYVQIQHYFIDSDDAIIPFNHPGGQGRIHVYGGESGIMGLEGLGFRVFLLMELPFRADRSDDSQYPGEHPLKNAKRFVAHIPGYGDK
jgi:hypothetical protein